VAAKNKDDKAKRDEDAQAVIDAAKKLFGKRKDREISDALEAAEDKWDGVQKDVEDLDKGFKDMENNSIGVRVMQVGPKGELTDVTDKVNPRDLRPEQIADFRTEGAMSIPLGPDGRIDREAALDILSKIMKKSGKSSGSSSEEAMKRMEAALNESDRILEHFKD
jgi:hypothetical protein